MLSVLLAQTALADAQHGLYSLGVDNSRWMYLKGVPSCGDRTKAVVDQLRSFSVSFRSPRAPRPHVTDEVLVDNEPWHFDGYTAGGFRWASASRADSKNVIALLWFGIDRHGKAEGSIAVTISEGTKAVCGDMHYLSGTYVAAP